MNRESSIVQCPECSSYNAEAVDISLPIARCRCTDCGTVHTVRVREVTNDDDDNGSADEDGEEEDFTPRRRKAKADYRRQIEPAPTPELAFSTQVLDQVIAAGPAGLRRAQRTALRYAKRYVEDGADSWKLETEWLKSFDAVHRARARYALVWRPRFLAALSMCHSPELAARHTRISCQMAYYHRKHDPQFGEQWDQAREYGIEMLHARAFQRALEGDLEPVYYMGVPVGYIRKFSDKLQIEMLRALMPQTFKTPGQAPINIDTGNKILVLDEATRMRLIEKRRQALELMPGPDEESANSHSVTAQPQALATSEPP